MPPLTSWTDYLPHFKLRATKSDFCTIRCVFPWRVACHDNAYFLHFIYLEVRQSERERNAHWYIMKNSTILLKEERYDLLNFVPFCELHRKILIEEYTANEEY